MPIVFVWKISRYIFFILPSTSISMIPQKNFSMPSVENANAKSFSVEKEAGNAKKTDVKLTKKDEKSKFLSTQPSFPCFFFFKKPPFFNRKANQLLLTLLEPIIFRWRCFIFFQNYVFAIELTWENKGNFLFAVKSFFFSCMFTPSFSPKTLFSPKKHKKTLKLTEERFLIFFENRLPKLCRKEVYDCDPIIKKNVSFFFLSRIGWTTCSQYFIPNFIFSSFFYSYFYFCHDLTFSLCFSGLPHKNL